MRALSLLCLCGGRASGLEYCARDCGLVRAFGWRRKLWPGRAAPTAAPAARKRTQQSLTTATVASTPPWRVHAYSFFTPDSMGESSINMEPLPGCRASLLAAVWACATAAHFRTLVATAEDLAMLKVSPSPALALLPVHAGC